ncbi:PHD and RING finger domain-containing protein 1 isoform B [Glycine soja]|nr:PHD and RING finger domain-containing protein 1 isoform B [Glycine soja]
MATGPADSYTETKCGVCHAGTDEHLLLLCDLCDTASHTYCVGLGYTVPEGDWFCHDCAISRKINIKEDSDQQNVVPTAEPRVTVDIFDIVRETGSQVVQRPRASPLQQNLSSPSVIPLPDRLSYLSRLKGKRPVTGFCHMQRNVKAFRENWNALRSGSLQFRCNSSQPGSTVSQKQDSSSLSHHKLDDLHSMASTSLQQSTVQGGPSNKMLNERVFKDADKAWKMMDRAKKIQLPHHRTGRVDKPSCSGGARKISLAHCNFSEVKDQHSKALDLRNTKKEKQCDYSRLNQNLENRSTLKLEEKRQSRDTCEKMIHVRDHTTHSKGYCERPLSRKVHTSIQGGPCREDGLRNVAEEQSLYACLVTSADLASSRDKFGSMFSNRGVNLVNEEKRLAKSSEDGNTRNIVDSKTEIQSLVKLNLKLLTRDKKLGFDTFKVVARQATHTILAACSSDQQKSSTSSSSSVCSHADNTPQFQKSTLMPNCCRQCFYNFVNNVVHSTILEKVGCA